MTSVMDREFIFRGVNGLSEIQRGYSQGQDQSTA